MKKSVKRVVICALLCACVGAILIVRDKSALKKQMIRLHVVGASDTAADQTLKLQVRDAVLNSLGENMDQSQDAEQAKAYLQDNLPEIKALADTVLHSAGYSGKASVSLQREAFPVRHYETFKLPSGVYETLRISIGEGKGHNWWCVVFPALCVGTTVEEFEESAQCAGLPDTLAKTLVEPGAYEVRFLILDAWGRLENFLYKG